MDELGAPAEAPVVETTAPEAPAVAPESAAPAAPVTNAPAEPKSRHDVIREAMKAAKDGTLRGQHATRQPREQGKFAGPPQAPQASQAPQQAPEVTPKPRPALLKSLKKELEPHWNTAPQELVEAFAEREAAFERGAQQWQTKAQQADALLEQFKPYEWILKAEGATPQTAIAPLLQTAALLRAGTPQQKAQSVAQMIQQFGIPVDQVTAYLGGQQPATDPQYNHLAQQFQTLQQTLHQTLQQQEQVQTQRALTVIQQFAQDPNFPHFDALQGRMLALLQAPGVFKELTGQDPTFLGEREKLELAYRTTLAADPSLTQQALAQQQQEAARKEQERQRQAAQAARAAAVQVRGAPGSPLATSVNPNDRRSVIANALRAATA